MIGTLFQSLQLEIPVSDFFTEENESERDMNIKTVDSHHDSKIYLRSMVDPSAFLSDGS